MSPNLLTLTWAKWKCPLLTCLAGNVFDGRMLQFSWRCLVYSESARVCSAITTALVRNKPSRMWNQEVGGAASSDLWVDRRLLTSSVLHDSTTRWRQSMRTTRTTGVSTGLFAFINFVSKPVLEIAVSAWRRRPEPSFLTVLFPGP